jgi:multidrug resistance protein, MATE family
MFMTFRSSWAYLFNDDEAVVAMVASILPVVALFQVFDGVSAVTAGILRAEGKQFTGALLNLRYFSHNTVGQFTYFALTRIL